MGTPRVWMPTSAKFSAPLLRSTISCATRSKRAVYLGRVHELRSMRRHPGLPTEKDIRYKKLPYKKNDP